MDNAEVYKEVNMDKVDDAEKLTYLFLVFSVGAIYNLVDWTYQDLGLSVADLF